MCGPDSDGDGYPDDNLPCADYDEHCKEVRNITNRV